MAAWVGGAGRRGGLPALSSLPTPLFFSRTGPVETIDWDAVIAEATAAGAAVPEVTWIQPGPAAALAHMTSFLRPDSLRRYATRRNDPTAGALSGLSPWLHFGQLSGQRLALAAYAARVGSCRAAADGLIEESVVRRELSDNFCHYEPHYDTLDGAAGWARETLEVHSADPREHTYTRAQLEAGATHDDLWNAAQKEMVVLGKMHGFMRMYWAKKILVGLFAFPFLLLFSLVSPGFTLKVTLLPPSTPQEWSPTPADALATAIHLNDTYELDGRDPSGYVGCMWSIAGVHDMGWAERAVFGKVGRGGGVGRGGRRCRRRPREPPTSFPSPPLCRSFLDPVHELRGVQAQVQHPSLHRARQRSGGARDGSARSAGVRVTPRGWAAAFPPRAPRARAKRNCRARNKSGRPPRRISAPSCRPVTPRPPLSLASAPRPRSRSPTAPPRPPPRRRRPRPAARPPCPTRAPAASPPHPPSRRPRAAP